MRIWGSARGGSVLRAALFCGLALALLALGNFETTGAEARPQPARAAGSAGSAGSAGQRLSIHVADPANACQSVGQEDFSAIPDAPAVIASASLSGAGETQYCQITGYVAPQIQFQMRLPAQAWNGDLLFVGCGGFCGSIAMNVVHAGNTDDYAVVAENEGHYGANELDALWGLGNRPAQIDWGYRAVHVVTVASKRIIAAFYGQSPKFSYFDGCSDGGREGLSEAQRFPADFNGIAAGDPNWLQNYLAAVAQGWVQKINYTASGQQILPSSKLGLVAQAVYKQCAGPNGLITDPAACKPDPASLACPPGTDTPTCLTPAQVKVVAELYRGPVNSHGTSLYPGGGLPAGSEAGWAALDVAVPGQQLPFAAVFANEYLKYLAFTKAPPPSYSVSQFNFDTDLHLLVKQGQVYNADNPDLSAFQRAGGKLILYHGASDPLISPYGTLYYYDEVADLMGGIGATQQFARLFLVPGMYHCAGGPGVSTFDALTPLAQWVQTGQAPQQILAEHLDNSGQVTISLPLFPYPSYAQYDGQGDPAQAQNYVEVTPPDPPDNDFCWIGWRGDTTAEAGGPPAGACIQPPGF